MSLSPDLRVVCRKLAAALPADLPALCPILVHHILQCGGPLSTSPEQHGKINKSKASESSVLVHKLKTQVNALLQGKTASGRFAGAALAKTIIDVGGWECLRTSEPWVRALLALLQEIAIVALTRIYTLLQPYPTLVREIATPTIPTFATACLQLIQPTAPSKAPKAPVATAETVTRALSALIPLYPTTLRPFVVQIRLAIRAFVAPTASDGLVVPSTLRASARRLLVLLHYTAAKNGNADEWSKLLHSLIRDAHATADQVYRAVRESRNPSSSAYIASQVSFDGEPSGGGDGAPDELPAWRGLQSGAQRLVGLLETVTEVFNCTTKLPVTVPLGALVDLTSRLAVILPPSPGTPDRDIAVFVNPSIEREERDELWSLIPSVHTAVLKLLFSLVRRMGTNAVPLASTILDDALLMFAASSHAPQIRSATYKLVETMLPVVGPSLARMTVDSLVAVVIRACCQDILEATGLLQQQNMTKGDARSAAAQNGANKSKAAVANADMFLRPGGSATTGPLASSIPAMTLLTAAHRRAAERLLAATLSHMPQQHVKKADRALLDRTAILSANKTAMIASVLHPYVDASGRYFANTIPFLARAYPYDLGIEILRSNLRTAPHFFGNIFAATAPGEGDENDDAECDKEDASMADIDEGTAASLIAESARSAAGFALPAVFTKRSEPATTVGVAAILGDVLPSPEIPRRPFEPLTLKRKSEETGPESGAASKRPDTGEGPNGPAATAAKSQDATVLTHIDDDTDDDSDGSVQLEMVFDDGGNEESDNGD